MLEGSHESRFEQVRTVNIGMYKEGPFSTSQQEVDEERKGSKKEERQVDNRVTP